MTAGTRTLLSFLLVEANGHMQWSMLVLPASIFLAVALRMIELARGKGGSNAEGGGGH